MAWNEPGGGGNNNQQDPWSGGDRRGGNGGGNKNQGGGPPDIDEVIRKLRNKLNGLLGRRQLRSVNGGDDNGGNNQGGGGRSALLLPIVVLIVGVVVWAGSGFHLIDQSERGVVFRFGKYTNTIGPGLHWNPPLIDRVDSVNVTRIRSASQTDSMLTRDENIVRVSISAQYVVSDPHAFLVNVRGPEMTLQNAMDSALRQEVGNMELQRILTTGREELAGDIYDRLASYLEAYGTGIRLQTVNMESTSPPDQVQDAFDDVIRAREEQQRTINRANAYRDAILPEAEGQRQRMIEEAQGYKAAVVADAQGDANRFISLLGEYEKAPGVTRERLYLDTMTEILSNTPKALVDLGEGNDAVTVLPLNQMGRSNNGSKDSGDSNQSSNVDARQLEQLSQQVVEHMRSSQNQNNGRSSLREGR
ncbi:FtsH protease activity modulator HflK [Kushneria konosiri]|uniref:Protein HflK n=1 Tax=Kushneria konosiri TaxID=698828 RepID=A0A2Z2H383_9GAMM|nr:FtsH protease activity modulator HflK [Kushneria konosiri]ARS51652.1 HflK protein [Kushneria konosiri]